VRCGPALLGKNSFLLTKWYLDCVAENGDVVILYVADLRWNTLSLRYGSLLTVLDGKVGSASSLHGIVPPKRDDRIIVVKHPGLNVEGTWEALRTPIRRTVFQNPQGEIDWHCWQPMSRVDLRLLRKIGIQGLGYAECLTVSVVPWQLPLTQLNWGRFLSPNDAVVWIDWQGGERFQSVLHNGEEYHADSITESEIVFGGKRIDLDCGLVVRQGRLGETVFRGISRLAGLLPRSMLSVSECKWRSRGVLQTAAGQSSGWTIHEVVKWKQ
jgi:hypothetical protein